jgi:hypothetical protein
MISSPNAPLDIYKGISCQDYSFERAQVPTLAINLGALRTTFERRLTLPVPNLVEVVRIWGLSGADRKVAIGIKSLLPLVSTPVCSAHYKDQLPLHFGLVGEGG